MTKTVLGIVGGSGVYDIPGLEDRRWERVASPWGEPSDELLFGRFQGVDLVFLPRHGRGHVQSPTSINYRANIDALKRAGVTDIISLSACGSFKREFYPGLFVLVDQFDDRTYRRETSFFGKGCVAHVSMAHPVSPRLPVHLAAAAQANALEQRADAGRAAADANAAQRDLAARRRALARLDGQLAEMRSKLQATESRPGVDQTALQRASLELDGLQRQRNQISRDNPIEADLRAIEDRQRKVLRALNDL